MTARNSTFDQNSGVEDIHRSAGMSIDDGSLIDKQSPPPYVTFRKGMSCNCREEYLDFQAGVKTMLETFLAKQDEKFTTLLSEFESVKSSIEFISAKYDDLVQRSNDLDTRLSKLEQNVASPHTSIQRIVTLEAKLEAAEQKSRSCNVEISNLPERRGENLLSVFENIASLIKQPLLPRDVIAIHRVPLMNPKAARPKNIVVKLSSQILRDNFIAAARLKKGITTDELKLTGNSQNIYINEHLTVQNKKLFRQTKEIAKQCGHRFVWIKHGIILVRADVSEVAFTIRSEEDLSKIKPYKVSG